jgi:sterol-4alpha-carboxylate 3-dehydrogenase (decarboxylating)
VFKRQTAIVSYPLPPVGGAERAHRIPTSVARPLGPVENPSEQAQARAAAFAKPVDYASSGRPVLRSRFDPLSDPGLGRQPADCLEVAGQVFFITNGEPLYFWDLPRMVWTRLAAAEPHPPKSRGIIKLSKDIGMVLATLAEYWGWLSGREPGLTRYRVSFSCVARWHNIEKARRVLGYEPVTDIVEGMNKTVEVSDCFLVSDTPAYTVLFSGGCLRGGRSSRHPSHDGSVEVSFHRL